jgi:hypothetical protein
MLATTTGLFARDIAATLLQPSVMANFAARRDRTARFVKTVDERL